jgi:hypothetical protein
VCAQRVLRAIIEAGARPARPGEFTLRAFLNGRLDLSQVRLLRGWQRFHRRLLWLGFCDGVWRSVSIGHTCTAHLCTHRGYCSMHEGGAAGAPGEFTLRAVLNGRLDLSQVGMARGMRLTL